MKTQEIYDLVQEVINFIPEAFERRYYLRMLLKQSKELIKEIGVSSF